MDIVFRPHYFGNRNNKFDEMYVPLAIKSAILTNPESKVYFISNYSNVKERVFADFDTSNLVCYTFSELHTDVISEFMDKYIHLSHNCYVNELYSILSFYYINNLMEKHSLNEAIVIDTPVLIFSNLTENYKKYFDLENYHAILANSNIVSCSYLKTVYKAYSSPPILKCLTSIFGNMRKGGISDRTFHDWINKECYGGIFSKMNTKNEKMIIGELSAVLEDKTVFDDSLTKAKTVDNIEINMINVPSIGLVKEIEYIDDLPYYKAANGALIRCHNIYFQGASVKLMSEVYDKAYGAFTGHIN
jgi:hypothetical protein